MLETDDQVAVLDTDGISTGQHEPALLAVGLFDVVLLVVGGGDLEPHPPRCSLGIDREGVGGVVLSGLDVVLVGVGPVQLHLLAVVGDQVGRTAPGGVATLGDEVALAVVAAEEVG